MRVEDLTPNSIPDKMNPAGASLSIGGGETLLEFDPLTSNTSNPFFTLYGTGFAEPLADAWKALDGDTSTYGPCLGGSVIKMPIRFRIPFRLFKVELRGDRDFNRHWLQDWDGNVISNVLTQPNGTLVLPDPSEKTGQIALCASGYGGAYFVYDLKFYL